MFSQNLEEKYILEYFGDYIGTFLDLGANDGIKFSNTRALALRGWKGVFVDASPQAMDRCRTLYKGFKGHYFYDLAITKHMGKDIFNESGSLIDATDIGLVSTFHKEEMARFNKTVDYNPIEVETLKWKTFLNRIKSIKIKHFDFMSIDIEGDELNVLPDMDLSKTKLICIEWNGKQHLKDNFEHYLDGFKLIYTSGENLVYGR